MLSERELTIITKIVDDISEALELLKDAVIAINERVTELENGR